MKFINHITALLLAVFFVLTAVGLPQTSQAQSAENNCEAPDFQITSSDSILAIAGENFSYYVVTSSDVDYQLTSQLPSGLNYNNGQITGAPTAQAVGDHLIEFNATNACGTTVDSVSLTVLASDLSSTPEGNNTVAQAEGEDNDEEDQGAAAGTVGLDDIPETGIVADTALTVGFYLLALLLIAGWFGRRLSFASVSRFDDDIDVIPSLRSRYAETNIQRSHNNEGDSRRFGDGIRR